MKTIEEKAKAYDEAIKKAKAFELPEYKNIMESVFPELKDSCDEKIRQDIIRVFKGEISFTSEQENEKYIAWLEKQKNTQDKEYVFRPVVGCDISYAATQAIEQQQLGYKIVLAFNGAYIPVEEKTADDIVNEYYSWIKKQAEPNPYDGVSFKCNGHTWGMCAKNNGVEILFDGELKAFLSLEKSFIYPIYTKPDIVPKSALEAIKEEKVDNQNCVKSADKIEPKFHPGDWIIRSDERFKYNTYLIKEIKDYYVCEELKGRRVTFTFNDVHKNFKLWDISDAKRGAVLVDEDNNIGLYLEENDDLYWHSCIYLGCDNRLRGFSIGGYHNHKNTKPATKEQHDLLFQKMKDAKWEFDSVTKELKRITKFKIGDKVHCGDETQSVTIIGITNDSYTTDSMIGPIPFSEEDNWTLIKHKFNVDDWIVFNGFILHIDEVVNGYYRTTSIGDGIHNSYDWDIDNAARLWTIADAKCGDVVVDKSDGAIGIFQSIGHHPDGGSYNDPSYCFLYCRYDDGFFYADFEHGNTINSNDLIPATKEQRELLFEKMTQAGWKWNAENNELSKQTLKITPKFCVGQLITDDNGTWYQITNIKCLDDWYYEVYDICEGTTHLELCSIIDEKFRENRFVSEIKKMMRD